MGEKIKINVRPTSNRFPKGASGCPNGGSKSSATESIADAVRRKLSEPVTDPVNRRRRINRYHLGARRLVIRAAEGDRKAINEVAEQRERAIRHIPKLRKLSYQEALKRKNGPELTPEFFARQAHDKAEFKRQIKGVKTFAEYVDMELRRRVKIDREKNGKVVRMNMQQVIVHNLSNDFASGDIAAITLVEKLAPTKRPWSPPSFTEVVPPTPEESAEKEAKDRDMVEMWRNSFKEDYPAKDWDNDDLLRAAMASIGVSIRF